MIKIKDMKSLAHKNGLKLAASAIVPASKIAREVVALAIEEAKNLKHPKLEAKHFGGIVFQIDYSLAGARKVIKRKETKKK